MLSSKKVMKYEQRNKKLLRGELVKMNFFSCKVVEKRIAGNNRWRKEILSNTIIKKIYCGELMEHKFSADNRCGDKCRSENLLGGEAMYKKFLSDKVLEQKSLTGDLLPWGFVIREFDGGNPSRFLAGSIGKDEVFVGLKLDRNVMEGNFVGLKRMTVTEKHNVGFKRRSLNDQHSNESERETLMKQSVISLKRWNITEQHVISLKLINVRKLHSVGSEGSRNLIDGRTERRNISDQYFTASKQNVHSWVRAVTLKNVATFAVAGAAG
ncbi:hypothetical protein LSTR_LSTR014379 [Laodelphax striatellus]|uniref:Uncharacterized protein n=1 Tax=Laodelphax striatellus TaxID=195883 RepID=A0A482XPK1_LAOST|nr:hypothetical protein LSTR_LSTR014379 [Laodelphax striatellus]